MKTRVDISDPARPRSGAIGVVSAFTKDEVAGLSVEPEHVDQDGDFVQVQLHLGNSNFNAPVTLVVDPSIGNATAQRLLSKVVADLGDCFDWLEGGLAYAEPKATSDLLSIAQTQAADA